MSLERQRRGIRIRGVVQGVGFRPAMYRLAETLGVVGFVRNDREGVWLELEGSTSALERFVDSIAGAAPLASRIDRVEQVPLATRGETLFQIIESDDPVRGPAAAEIPADLAPCEACLRELEDPSDRRFRYPFVNCTACGPRFTIVRVVPYDRPNTTMSRFAMCDACRREYLDPRDRRFHAEPIACPSCGPQVRFVGAGGSPIGKAAIDAAAAAIAAGAIVAVKGAGGFVLAVDATSERAVTRLRARKRRPHKPFAVMAEGLNALEEIAVVDGPARSLLSSAVRPVVLVPARAGSAIAPSVAPALGDIGVFLPPTPLQQLLLATGPRYQVMTSGNRVEEPIARTDDEACDRLAGIADGFLLHDREIHARADDSVVRVTSRGPVPIRRARGIVPGAIPLPVPGPPLLAVGGHERATVCLAAGGRAVLSQHLGDLDHVETDAFFREAIDHLVQLVGATPEAVAHDLHPDYRSTRWALASRLPRVAVQHHHAHVAACLAEHGRRDRVLGVAFDGTGLGADGQLWGGEVLEADLLKSRRRGHLRPLPLPGGEAAIREPWRLALAALHDAGESLELLAVDEGQRRQVRKLLEGDVASPRASGAGRWFDAVAALLGLARAPSYDGQAAAELEALAQTARPSPPAPLAFAIEDGDPFSIDLRPTIRELARRWRGGADAAVLARRFHDTLAAAIVAACRRVRGPATVVLTGGCFQNRILVEQTASLLEAEGFEVLLHRQVPPNDGGLALGQAAVAWARLAQQGASCA